MTILNLLTAEDSKYELQNLAVAVAIVAAEAVHNAYAKEGSNRALFFFTCKDFFQPIVYLGLWILVKIMYK